MKKSLIIALFGIAVMLAACKKPVDYTPNYVGHYIGQVTLTINSMNNQAVSNMTFPIDSISMDITKGDGDNTITATVSIENETHQANGTVTEQKADFESVHLVIDQPDQFFRFELDLKMEGTKAESDTLNITGAFTGNGSATLMGQETVIDEVSGTVVGKLVKQ